MAEETDLSAELDGAFVSGERTWKGQPLAPYTEGSRLLMAQVRSEEDAGLFFIWAFLYLHLELRKDRKNAIRLCWNREAFREAVLDFSSGMTIADRDAAAVVVNAMLDEAARAETEVQATGRPAPPGNA
jgi:hypothetical protein